MMWRGRDRRRRRIDGGTSAGARGWDAAGEAGVGWNGLLLLILEPFEDAERHAVVAGSRLEWKAGGTDFGRQQRRGRSAEECGGVLRRLQNAVR